MLKRCNICGVEKPATSEHFYARAASKDGLAHRCKGCARADSIAWSAENAARRAVRDAKYQRDNREKINKRKLDWARKNAERVKQQKRASADRLREEQRERKNAAARERYATDPLAKLDVLFSAGVRRSLRDGKAGRSWESLVGYTVVDLKRHIERQFASGMSWESYQDGRIHIDHIRPMSSFDLSSMDQFRDCWSLSNLRPLWAFDNLSKGSRRLFLI